jgi:hypothetical protein
MQTTNGYPDALARPQPEQVAFLLAEFWRQLANLPGLINRQEELLAARCTARLRDLVLELMLALNGIQYPIGTGNLNRYLGESQRTALYKTLRAPEVSGESWLGQAVALVVIYRWYAPQLVAQFKLDYPQAVEAATWATLQHELPDWPLTVTTE